MPSSDYSSVEHRPPSRSPHLTGGPPEKDQQLRCPRCDSINTKFCYYNNYNLSQPRHFCKGCRRYWTQGGTLRDVPIGGGTRKNSSKRFRKPSSTSYSSSSSLSPIPEPVFANPISSRPIPTSVSSTISDHHHHHHHFNGVGGSFASLLNPQPSPTLLAFNGFGYDDMVTFETGKGVVWPLGFGENNTHSGGIGLIGGGIGNTWQLGIAGGAASAGGDASGGGGDSDFYTWPELGMSTPRRGVK